MKTSIAMMLAAAVVAAGILTGGENALAGLICQSYTYNPNLVRRVQEKLLHEGIDSRLSVNGKWGPKTQAALRNFQFKHHLTVTGEINEQTFAQLFGREATYEGVVVVENPHHAPDDIYRRECR
jgi:hypothetical protein